jgi:hypothetical protein
MTRRAVVVAVLFLLLMEVGCVFAFNEPEGFRGVPWGTTEEQMRSSVSIERACADYSVASRYLGDRFCPALLPIGDINVRAIYSFRANRLTRVSLHFASKDFERLAAIFLERYGPATTRDREGLVWSGKTTSVLLLRHLSTDITRGYAEITTLADSQETKRLRDEQTKGAAKGL